MTETHRFETRHPDWYMPRCAVCREMEDHPVHRVDTAAIRGEA